MPAEGASGVIVVVTLYSKIKSLFNIGQTTFNSNSRLHFSLGSKSHY